MSRSVSPAEVIAARLRRRGFRRCTADLVRLVLEGDSLDDAALESAILQEMDE